MYRMKCSEHGYSFMEREALLDWWDYMIVRAGRKDLYGYQPCRECKRVGVAEIVNTKKGKRECGAWCEEGIGRSCTCVCEGRNHGAKYQHTGALWYAR